MACTQIDHDKFMSIMHAQCSQVTISQAHINNFESLWAILNDATIDGFPDGAEFLQVVDKGLDDPDDESAEIFLSFFGIKISY